MMTAAIPARDDGPMDALLGALRAGAAGFAGLFVLLAVFLAAVAAALVGVLIALAAMALRIGARPRPEHETLEGRKTPKGWVVEIR